MRTTNSKLALTTLSIFTFSIFAANAFSVINNQDGKNNPAPEKPTKQQLRAGYNFMQTKVYTQEQDQQILKLFKGLRVSDVSDGMDKAGLANIGLMSPEIHASWKDTIHFTHRFIGIAITVRYVPTNQPPIRGNMSIKEFDDWVDYMYANVTGEPFDEIIHPGTALVIDDDPSTDAGNIGSHNILEWKSKGCVGVVTGGGARDTDEVAAQKIPLYIKTLTRGIRPGRNIIESVNRPVCCGGVLVRPGDVIVADGDGVIVVPREKAKEVAEYALDTTEGDKAGRRELYKKLGLKPDDSVK
jgi:4-hydroxy-4-methyl-2-oxoglutarate aldolase